MVDNLGKVLVLEAVAGNVSQLGPLALVGEATLLEPDTVELSFCSQQYVIGSFSGSVAEPVNANGVLMGMV